MEIFVQCLHPERRKIVPAPWRFLTPPELLKGSRRLTCNSDTVSKVAWYMRSSLKPDIHIIDRVLYCRMASLSPIIENWLWKWYRGIEKIFFKLIFVFFSCIFHLFCALVLQHVWVVWKYLYGNHDYVKSKNEADFVFKQVRRPKIFFARSGPMSEEFIPCDWKPLCMNPNTHPLCLMLRKCKIQ